MAVTPLVAALGLELEHPQLLAALVAQHLRSDLHLLQPGLVEHRLIGAVQDRLKRHVPTLVDRKALHEQGLTPLDAVLLATCLHDCVHGLPSRCLIAPWQPNGVARPCGHDAEAWIVGHPRISRPQGYPPPAPVTSP